MSWTNKYLSAKKDFSVRADRSSAGINEKWKVIFTGFGKKGKGLAPGSSYVVLISSYKRVLTPRRNGKVKADVKTIGPK